MADNYLEKKMEALQERKAEDGRAKRDAWQKRMNEYRKNLPGTQEVHRYTVAGHTFKITLPSGCSAEDFLMPYAPFEITDQTIPALFGLKVQLVERLEALDAGVVKDCFNDEAPYFWMLEKDGSFNFGFSYSKSRPDCILMPSEDYSEATLYVPKANYERMLEFAISNSMMLLYTFRTAPYDTLMTHASVIAYDGGGYMFLGRSGTGKSTHSRLWLNNIEGTELLNDDNPVIRIIGDEAIIYGTPWSGKTPCYKNQSMPLKAVVRLSQAPFNKIDRQRPLQAFASLMPSCSCMRWDNASVTYLHKTVEKVVSKVPMYALQCLPDADAAHTCHSAVYSPR